MKQVSKTTRQPQHQKQQTTAKGNTTAKRHKNNSEQKPGTSAIDACCLSLLMLYAFGVSAVVVG